LNVGSERSELLLFTFFSWIDWQGEDKYFFMSSTLDCLCFQSRFFHDIKQCFVWPCLNEVQLEGCHQMCFCLITNIIRLIGSKPIPCFWLQYLSFIFEGHWQECLLMSMAFLLPPNFTGSTVSCFKKLILSTLISSV
jgi:hypothetical protein